MEFFMVEAVGWNKFGGCWVEQIWSLLGGALWRQPGGKLWRQSGGKLWRRLGGKLWRRLGGNFLEAVGWKFFWMQLGGVFHPTASTVETDGWKAFGGTPVGNFGDGRVENYVEEISRRRKLSGDSFCRLLSAYK